MYYQLNYVEALKTEARVRYDVLMQALQCTEESRLMNGKKATRIDGLQVRLAVEGFKAVLAEIKKLK
jgi:hypothetical protein